MKPPNTDQPKDEPPAAHPSGPRVLIAEDEFLVALLIEDDLRTSGFSIIGPFTELEEARRAASAEQIDVAVLDINMNGEMSFTVADELLARGIPPIFLSGYESATLPKRYRSVPRIAKPYDPVLLVKEIRRLIGPQT